VSPAPDRGSRSGKSERRAQREAAIAAACARLFIDRGYEATSIEDISVDLEMSAGGLYRYISTKSDLLVLVCEGIYGELPALLEKFATSDQGYEERLGSVCGAYLKSCELNHDLILLMYREYRHLPDDAQQRFKEREKAVARTFQRLIVEGQELGLVSRRLPVNVAANDLVMLGHLPALKLWAISAPRKLLAEQMEVLTQMLGLDEVPPTNSDLSGKPTRWGFAS
jgi:TetR/AcrR family transcriptional regulator, cholesterol catabolism regulator